jgi:SAM-dependent methyltransferase
VGPQGAVVGIDRDPVAVSRARERAKEAGASWVTFREGDFRALPVEAPFDAVVGRFVLMYAADPAEAVQSLMPHLRGGGMVAFQEMDYTALTAVPPSALYHQLVEWWNQTAGHAGIELQMGYKLYPTYRAAGLPGPRLQADLLLGGGPDFGGYEFLANVFRSILPLMERFGVATAEEVAIETLAQRLREELVGSGGCLALPLLVGAVAYKP